MKNNILKILAASFLLCFYSFANAQETTPTDLQIKELQQEIKTLKELVRNNNSNSTTFNKNEAPISKNYAVGKNGKLFAVINPKENTVEILSQKDGKMININQVLIDRIDGVYNIQYIYLGQNVEIYNDNIIYLPLFRLLLMRVFLFLHVKNNSYGHPLHQYLHSMTNQTKSIMKYSTFHHFACIFLLNLSL